MLVQLLPEQISEYWDLIAPSIEGSLPPFVYASKEKMINILYALLSSDMQCWFIVNSKESIKGKNIIAIVTTTIIEEGASKIKNLQIFTLFSRKVLTDSLFKDAYNTLSKFAKSKGCFRIVAYSDVERIISVVSRLGGETKYKFITLEV